MRVCNPDAAATPIQASGNEQCCPKVARESEAGQRGDHEALALFCAKRISRTTSSFCARECFIIGTLSAYYGNVSAVVDDITARGAQFRERVHGLLRRHEYPNQPKTVMMVGYAVIAIQHHKAIWLLKEAALYGSAFALVRPVFDAWLRALWINAIATPEQIEQATHDKLRFPSVDKMLADIRPVYFGHAQQDAEFKEMVDKLFYFLSGPNLKDKADPRVTSLWKGSEEISHLLPRGLTCFFIGKRVG
jgi:hypothetical protein